MTAFRGAELWINLKVNLESWIELWNDFRWNNDGWIESWTEFLCSERLEELNLNWIQKLCLNPEKLNCYISGVYYNENTILSIFLIFWLVIYTMFKLLQANALQIIRSWLPNYFKLCSTDQSLVSYARWLCTREVLILTLLCYFTGDDCSCQDNPRIYYNRLQCAAALRKYGKWICEYKASFKTQCCASYRLCTN